MDRVLRLLVIEDEPEDYFSLLREIRHQGICAECTWVKDKPSLDAELHADHWDAVLSDYRVTGIDFLDTVNLVRRLDPLLPVILVTGTVGDEEAVELVKRGAWDFLLKDRPTRLSAVLDRNLREARERRALAAAEEALRQREALLDAFFHNSPSGMVVLDRQFRHIKVNDALAAINGLPVEAHLGRTVAEIVPGLAPKIERIYQEIATTRRPVLDVEIAGETPREEGGAAHWLTSHFPILDGEGEILAVGGIVTEITARKRVEEALRESEGRAQELLKQNRYLTHRIFRLLEKERRHLAQELHDELGQWLTAIQAEAEAIRLGAAAKDGASHAGASAIIECATQVQAVIRRLVNELRPALLDALGLADSLAELISQWRRHHGVDCQLSLEGRLDDLGESLNITVYRIVQEALTNVAKHAQASRVCLILRRVVSGGNVPEMLHLTIENDGQGLPAEASTRGAGLLGMRERTIALGGEFFVESPGGSGARIEVRLPVLAGNREEAS